MREVEITASMIEKAKKKAANIGALKNSLTKGGGNLAGFLGEELVTSLLPSSLHKSTKDYDLIYTNKKGEDVKIEVKTKRRGVEPLPHYTCHVTGTSTHQKTDIYIFCQVNMRKEPYRGWVLGWISAEDFYKTAEFKRKGEVDGYGHKERADSYVCKISDLKELDL